MFARKLIFRKLPLKSFGRVFASKGMFSDIFQNNLVLEKRISQTSKVIEFKFQSFSSSIQRYIQNLVKY